MTTPTGYRRLEKGEEIQFGDCFYDPAGNWCRTNLKNDQLVAGRGYFRLIAPPDIYRAIVELAGKFPGEEEIPLIAFEEELRKRFPGLSVGEAEG